MHQPQDVPHFLFHFYIVAVVVDNFDGGPFAIAVVFVSAVTFYIVAVVVDNFDGDPFAIAVVFVSAVTHRTCGHVFFLAIFFSTLAALFLVYGVAVVVENFEFVADLFSLVEI